MTSDNSEKDNTEYTNLKNDVSEKVNLNNDGPGKEQSEKGQL